MACRAREMNLWKKGEQWVFPDFSRTFRDMTTAGPFYDR